MSVRPPAAGTEGRLGAHARTLLVDQVTASVSERLAARRIASILLKGPGFGSLLYEHAWERTYADTDLLVSIRNRSAAERVLVGLGFARIDRDAHWLGPAPKYSHTFGRPVDGAIVDLHWRLPGVDASPERVWSVLSSRTVQLKVAGRWLAVPDRTAGALLAALHTAHHGTRRPQAVTDLEHAVARIGDLDWRAAAALADELGAGESFTAGLRVLGAGAALADRLGLRRAASVEMWLKTNPSSHGAWVLDRLTQTPTVAGRLRICLRLALPPRIVMYEFSPLARRGQVGLALGYACRPIRLLAHARPALQDWVRARRALRGTAGGARPPLPRVPAPGAADGHSGR